MLASVTCKLASVSAKVSTSLTAPFVAAPLLFPARFTGGTGILHTIASRDFPLARVASFFGKGATWQGWKSASRCDAIYFNITVYEYTPAPLGDGMGGTLAIAH